VKPLLKKLRLILLLLLVGTVILLGDTIYKAYSLPSTLRLLPGQEYVFPLSKWLNITAEHSDISLLDEGNIRFKTDSLGEQNLELSLFGIPLKRTQVNVVSRKYMIPGGHSIGVLIGTGVKVTQIIEITGSDGVNRSPAKEGGIQVNDLIKKVGDESITHGTQLEKLVQEYGRNGLSLPLVVERYGRELRLSIKPVLTTGLDGQKKYLLGIWVKDSTAGVGTLTFFDPESLRFAALGHQIITTEELDPEVLVIGQLVRARIEGINPGAKGSPGEKIGFFDDRSGPFGLIDKNTSYGIYGTLLAAPSPLFEPLPVALVHEVKPGPAKILTVITGETVESFDINILEVTKQSRPNDKGMIIQITDPRLLKKTNGIIQGMSGSPIIQDGYIVGAVTHVFVNDPTKGYGILAEWMVYEAGLSDTLITGSVQSDHFAA
jgi:stage IV sporulation protein B